MSILRAFKSKTSQVITIVGIELHVKMQLFVTLKRMREEVQSLFIFGGFVFLLVQKPKVPGAVLQ